ncbi:MAG: MBL fold metallo-hydrolase [Clostridia bacterium]|nr:MBL fold metallo-hydrolase [Clostridia bacterium]
MKISFLGTCAGTEPMERRRYSSFVLETCGKLYWFDAGEGCSRTAHLMGIDLLNISNIFISHAHIDHIGGLTNLLWQVTKLSMIKVEELKHGKINLFLPDLKTLEGVRELLRPTLKDYEPYGIELEILPKEVADGLLIHDDNIKVSAYHNHHLKKGPDEPWRSFCYKIEAEGKTLVYSGDLGSYSDLDDALSNGCDALIIETGHFKIDEVYEYCHSKNVDKVLFSHCGKEILENYEASALKVNEVFGEKAVICEDRMVLEL